MELFVTSIREQTLLAVRPRMCVTILSTAHSKKVYIGLLVVDNNETLIDSHDRCLEMVA